MTDKPPITDSALDAMLHEWARRTPRVAGSTELAARAMQAPARWPRFAGFGALAAAAVAAFVLVTPPALVPVATPVADTVAAEAADDAAFASLFTLTPDEEILS